MPHPGDLDPLPCHILRVPLAKRYHPRRLGLHSTTGQIFFSGLTFTHRPVVWCSHRFIPSRLESPTFGDACPMFLDIDHAILFVLPRMWSVITHAQKYPLLYPTPRPCNRSSFSWGHPQR